MTSEIEPAKVHCLARAALDALSAHVAIVDEKGLILLVNAAWRKFAAANPPVSSNLAEGANYLAVCEAVTGPDAEQARAFATGIREVQKGKRASFRLEYACNSPLEVRWFLGQVTRLPDANLKCVVVSHETITDRKLTELEFAENRQRLRLALDSAGMGIWHWDIVNDQRHFDVQTCRLLGLDPETFRGTSQEFFDAVNPFDRDRIRSALSHALNRDSTHNADYKVTWPDGSHHFVSMRGRIIRDAHGKPLRLAGVAWDQSERVRAEHAIYESEERFRQLAELFPETIFEADVSGRLTYANEHGLNKFGASLNDVENGLNVVELVLPEDRPKVLQRLRDRLDNRPGKFLEYRAMRRTGEVFDALAYSAPMYEMNRAVGIRGFILDISERKQAEQLLLKTNLQLEAATARANRLAAQAEQASAAKGEFLANMSHEIRTPLNGVIGMTGLLLETQLSDEQRRYAEAVQVSAELLLALVNDILDFSKIEAGKLSLESLDFELMPLLNGVVEVMAVTARSRSLALTCTTSEALPSAMRGDPSRLRQVLFNLVGNALKFTKRGEVAIRVDLEHQTDRELLVRFSIHDTGIGIPESKLGVLFDKFTQGDASTTRKFGGTGLGLAISKQLTELMGGKIGVRSTEGLGSEFWFTILFASPEVSAQGKRARPADEILHQSIGPLQARLRVLVVEDNPTNQMVALGILRRLGHLAEAVANGREAIETLRAIPYDLVLMDVQMPEMDGLEATRTIRQGGEAFANSGIPIVAMTAHAMRGDRDRCLQAGMDDYIAKPVTPAALSQVIEKWQERTRALNSRRASSRDINRVPLGDTVFCETSLFERVMGDRALARVVIEGFLVDMHKQLAMLEDFAKKDDLKAVELQAHTIKGAAAAVSGDALEAVAALLEQAGASGDRSTVKTALGEVGRQFERLKIAIQRSSALQTVEERRA